MATQRSKSFLAAEVIETFVDLKEWQLAEVQLAIEEANAGDFADEKEVRNVLHKWGVNEG